jgi:putative transposase
MVTPTQRRAMTAWAMTGYALSERKACQVVGVARSLVRYQGRRPPQDALRRRLRELAASRVHLGYQQLTVYLRREGWAVNHKRVYRLYVEEGLVLRRRRPKRRRSVVLRGARAKPSAPDEQWAMDFVHDTLADGSTIRIFVAIDLFARECLVLEAARAFTGAAVATALEGAVARRGKKPSQIRADNGTEFTSKTLDAWAYWNQVALDFSRPGKPVDNAFVESFNATLRRECLSQHWFTNLEDAARRLGEWKDEYNNDRPHSSLGHATPTQFRASATLNLGRTEAEKSQN